MRVEAQKINPSLLDFEIPNTKGLREVLDVETPLKCRNALKIGKLFECFTFSVLSTVDVCTFYCFFLNRLIVCRC